MSEFESEQIEIIAGSVDPTDKTRKMIPTLGLSYPITCGSDAEAISEITGAFHEKEKNFATNRLPHSSK